MEGAYGTPLRSGRFEFLRFDILWARRLAVEVCSWVLRFKWTLTKDVRESASRTASQVELPFR